MRTAFCLLAALSLAGPAIARPAAETPAAEAPSADGAPAPPVDESDIIITGWLPPSHGTPERSLEGEDIAAYGLGTVGEVVAEIAAEDGDAADDPAFLVNGRRVAGLGNVSDLPAEAIVRIDVLPAGSGVKVGASPRQRLYDIQLRHNLDLAAARAALRLPTRGGWSARRAELSYSHIRGERRITLAAKARDEPMLLESERFIVQPPTALPGAGAHRTLLPATDRIDLSLYATDRLASWLSGSLVSKASLGHRHALLGPFAAAMPGVPLEPLDQRGRTLSGSVDLSLDAQAGAWQIGLFGSYISLRGRTATDRLIASEPRPLIAVTGSTVRTLSSRVSAFGPLLQLPAGPLVLNLGAGISRDAIVPRRNESAAGARARTTLTATTVSAAVELPIASRSAHALAAIGDLSASAELVRQHASDFGSFNNYTVSLLWRPVEWLGLTGSISRSDSAPPVTTLDEPPVATPGVRIFDPARGETVDVTWITGGTSSLGRQGDETRRVAANLKPLRSVGFRLNAEYLETKSRNLVSELPAPGLAIMQAFPERFVRDGDGRLVSVDARPVSFASRTERQVRTGLVLTLPLGRNPSRNAKLAEDEDDEIHARRARAGVRPRLQLSAAMSWLLDSALSIRRGGPEIDLLSRDAIGFGGLGQPRRRFDASLGYAERGLGVRASIQSRGASLIEANGAVANVLRFHPLTTFSLRAWVQGERLAPRSGWMKGTRLSLSLLNVTDVRERVEDRFGATPLSYQPGYRDPIGRSFELELRKTF